MIFLGLIIYPKIMKIVLPLSYHEMNIYKNFGLSDDLGSLVGNDPWQLK